MQRNIARRSCLGQRANFVKMGHPSILCSFRVTCMVRVRAGFSLIHLFRKAGWLYGAFFSGPDVGGGKARKDRGRKEAACMPRFSATLRYATPRFLVMFSCLWLVLF